jgi:hypothetical protein
VRLGARGTPRLTYQLRLALEPGFFDCAGRGEVPWALWLLRETRRTSQPRRQFDSGPRLRWDIQTLRVDSHRGTIRASRVRRHFRSAPIQGRILRLRSALQCGRDEPPESQLLARPSGRTDRTRTAQVTLTAQLGAGTHFRRLIRHLNAITSLELKCYLVAREQDQPQRCLCRIDQILWGLGGREMGEELVAKVADRCPLGDYVLLASCLRSQRKCPFHSREHGVLE